MVPNHSEVCSKDHCMLQINHLFNISLDLVANQITFQILLLTFNALHNYAPTYLTNHLENYTPACSLTHSLLLLSRSTHKTRQDGRLAGQTGRMDGRTDRQD